MYEHGDLQGYLVLSKKLFKNYTRAEQYYFVLVLSCVRCLWCYNRLSYFCSRHHVGCGCLFCGCRGAGKLLF